MNRNTKSFVFLAHLLFLILFSSFFSCGGEGENKGTGLGITEDVGNSCTGLCKDTDWCADVSLASCGSLHCVGPAPDKMYCTQLCENQGMCPEGYLCTDNCSLDASDQPYCVTSDDYDYLVSLGKCGAAL